MVFQGASIASGVLWDAVGRRVPGPAQWAGMTAANPRDAERDRYNGPRKAIQGHPVRLGCGDLPEPTGRPPNRHADGRVDELTVPPCQEIAGARMDALTKGAKAKGGHAKRYDAVTAKGSIGRGGRVARHHIDLIPITLRVALLSMPLVFLAAVLAFWITARYFAWPSTDEQRTTAIYIAIALSMIPVGAYVLYFLSQSRASVGVKALGTDITLDFSKNVATVRPLALPENILVPGTYGSLAHSGSEEVIRAISRTTSASVVTLDIKDGKAWWPSRLFALSAGAVRFGAPEAIVFLATEENVDKIFVGWAEPRPIFETVMRAYPAYEECYLTARAIFNQLSLFPVPDPTPDITPQITLPSGVANYQYAYAEGKDYAFLQILLDRLSALEPPCQEPFWMTRSFLADSFGHCWHRQAIDLESPVEAQVEQVLDLRETYIALVQEGRFAGMMTSQLATNMILKQLVSA